jgi:hypothetical protein
MQPFPTNFQLGGPGYALAIADYDGDSLLDPAVYNKTTGDWKMYRSTTSSIQTISWAANGPNNVPVPADYDGDGKAELAVFDTTTAWWYIYIQSWLGTFRYKQWGNPGDIPVPADYDGDGFDDITIWRPGDGMWWVLRRNETTVYVHQWGSAGYVPLSYMPW